jgi:hypothetical protein
MMARRKSVPSVDDIMGGKGRAPKENRLLSAIEFARATEDPKLKGATQHAVTGEMLKPGVPGYMVGGEPDTAGNKITESRYPSIAHFHLGAVVQERDRVQRATGNRSNAHLGSWWEDDEVVVDASGRYLDRDKAVAHMERRGETALWDNANMQEIRNTKKAAAPTPPPGTPWSAHPYANKDPERWSSVPQRRPAPEHPLMEAVEHARIQQMGTLERLEYLHRGSPLGPHYARIRRLSAHKNRTPPT